MSSRDNEELWKNELEKYLKISINDSSKSSILKEIFKDVITPQVIF